MPDPSPPPSRGSFLPLLLAGALLLLVVVALAFMTFGYFALVVLVAAGVFGLGAFHYLVWGRWLTAKLLREAEEERVRAGHDRPRKEEPGAG